jgi:tRNA(Ile)-lysidine synthase
VSDLEPQVRDAGLLAPGRAVFVLYSGGRDSTCLLDLAARIAGPGAVSALHVNYGLRGVEADGDEAHCAARCDALGVELQVRRVTRSSDEGNVQAWARRERYAAARELAGAAGAEIAAGHTATDQLETILYRLASSPSRRALLGMRARDDSRPPALVRPLLTFTREQTAAHCRARGLDWREDASNGSQAYARGRVRHELVPALARVHPAAAANVLSLAEVLAGEAAVLDALVDELLAGSAEIAVVTLRAQPSALRRLLVQRLADAAAGEPAAGVARRADEVAALPERGVAELHLPHGVRACARDGVIRFEPTPARRP